VKRQFAAFLVLFLFSCTLSPTPSVSPASTPTAASPCLERTGPTLVLSGAYASPYRNTSLAANTKIDSRLAKWIHAEKVPFRIGGGPNACVEGGEVIGDYPLQTSWDDMHKTYAIEIRGGVNYLLSNMRVHNYGDGIFIGVESNQGFLVRGAYLTQIRDDAVSDDYGWAGTIDDSLIDGTYVGFSDKGFAVAANDAVLNISRTLVRLQVYEQTYRNGPPGHGWFWKFDSDSIKLSLHGNIFFATEPSIHGTHRLIPEKVISCKKADGRPDNTIVWGGSGPYPRPEELSTGCFRLTTDRRVWDAAVAAWKAAHSR
jgi:hypothetical protein